MPIRGYSTSLRVARHIRFGPAKAVRSLSMRQSAAGRWIDWARTTRDSSELLWVHGASVGELLAANPVVRRIKRSLPQLQVIYTHTSPSVEQWGYRFPVAHTDYLPLGDAATVGRVIDALAPSLIAISRGDLWPELLDAAGAAGVPVGVIGAEISRSSSRLAWPWRSIFRGLYRDLAFVCANTESDSTRFASVGTPEGVIDVCGDPRTDEVVESVSTLADPKLLGRPRTSVLAGSTEPEDELVILEAWAAIDPGHRPTLTLVPHSPCDAEVARLEEVSKSVGLECSVASRDPKAPPDTVRVVDCMGVLSGLYCYADIAYVGGGFRRRGLHSVLEPAVFGLPVIFGPHWRGYPEATLLVEGGGAFPLDAPRAAQPLADLWLRLATDGEFREAAGLRARKALLPGAATRTADRVVTHLKSGSVGVRRMPEGTPGDPETTAGAAI